MSRTEEREKLAIEALETAVKLVQHASRLTEGKYGICLGRAHTALDEARTEVLNSD